MSEKKVIIIGSGLGGLACGVILAKNGYNVAVLEKERQVGGCLQCFVRKGAKFETGMHFIGSAMEGQTLNKLLNYLGVLPHVTLSQLDTDAYDIVALNRQTFEFANGRDAFLKKMTDYFPKQKENLNNYFNLIEKVAGASSMHSLSLLLRSGVTCPGFSPQGYIAITPRALPSALCMVRDGVILSDSRGVTA